MMYAMAVVVTTTTGANADIANCVELALSKPKYPSLDAATKVCGLSENHQ